MITINGAVLPAPHSLSVQVMKIGGSRDYNALGQLVEEGMREKRRVELAWRRMADAQLHALQAALQEAAPLSLVCPDPSARQREMLCTLVHHAATVWHYEQGEPAWADVQLILEEL